MFNISGVTDIFNKKLVNVLFFCLTISQYQYILSLTRNIYREYEI
nr:MAG TPA: hypothetical protein [Caudoviricetes sp.]